MARRARIEIEGGLYHVITRGNDRGDIFHSPADYERFLRLLAELKEKLPFYLYAYCLMTNHIHLLIERRSDAVGRIMHRVLTGYSQYYNRKYGKAGQLLQGRHKSILCQSDPYITTLVRYIHLNPVRAKMVERPEDYAFSSHLAYTGEREAGIVDVDPVLRRFAADKERARFEYAAFVSAGMGEGYRPDLYAPAHDVLGSEEFVDEAIHRLGDAGGVVRPANGRLASTPAEFDEHVFLRAVELVTGVRRDEFRGSGKSRRSVRAKEILIVAGRRFGVNVTTLARLTGLSTANVTRRHTAALAAPDPSNLAVRAVLVRYGDDTLTILNEDI